MTMREASLYAGIAMCLAASLAAAQDAPKAEIFSGYSYLQGNPTKTGGFASQGRAYGQRGGGVQHGARDV